MIGFIAPYTIITRDYRQYSAIADVHTFQFTAPHALGFSVSTSRILATDLSKSHCNIKLHMKSSFHSLILFLPLLSTQFNSSSSKLIYWQAGIPKVDSSFLTRLLQFTTVLSCRTLPYNHFARTTQKTASIIKEVCLLIHYLATDVLLLRAFACARMC
jgi:hypothetical protein